MEINNILFHLIYQGSGEWRVLDSVFVVLTSYITYIVIIGTILHFLLHPLFSKDKSKAIYHKKAFKNLIFSLSITAILVWVVKLVFLFPRPFVNLENVTPLVNAAPFESFPSAHAAITMALAISILPYHKNLGHLLIAFSFVIALSRLYVGVHYPFDIGVGLLIGFIVSKLINKKFATVKK